ncbi:MAG: diheme cytochrome c [Ferrovibrio sp.]|uniref:diheme cytochrome c n=1 Tax=Ferrovibrio sp. TaxID=1917215 RepID=UPI00260A6188|nr:diheme cytochrome c [Ferrovibrio sp.]MCW0235366.1 diheme cytochrome c [Ferrovibrio sp.]
MTRLVAVALAILLQVMAVMDALAGSKYLPPVTDALTRKACGECHMPFPPGFLPGRSWSALMGGLDDHFGEDAALPPEQAAQIEAYLVQNASNGPNGRGLRDFMRWVAPAGTPQRITENPAFLREHDFPDRVWRDPKVVTKSNCLACHPRADQGWFDD